MNVSQWKSWANKQIEREIAWTNINEVCNDKDYILPCMCVTWNYSAMRSICPQYERKKILFNLPRFLQLLPLARVFFSSINSIYINFIARYVILAFFRCAFFHIGFLIFTWKIERCMCVAVHYYVYVFYFDECNNCFIAYYMITSFSSFFTFVVIFFPRLQSLDCNSNDRTNQVHLLFVFGYSLSWRWFIQVFHLEGKSLLKLWAKEMEHVGGLNWYYAIFDNVRVFFLAIFEHWKSAAQ